MRTALCLALILAVQTTAAPSFDVAAIKPNKSGTNRSNLDLQPGGRFTAINVSLFMLINVAFGDGGPLPPNRLVFAPQWHGGKDSLATERFDILAKADGELKQSDIPAALRALLADRFKLVVHHETRERATYALMLVRADGRLGPRLKRPAVDCSNPNAAPPNADGTPSCGFRSLPGRATGRATMADLARRLLARAVEDQRVVEDRTGLEGTFEFDLEWTPNQPSPPDAPAGPPIDPNGASLFTALKEQLGLKLEPQRDQIDVLVIDRAEYPSQD
jgi:uncharacterized protein (TIGR03435 family)